MGPRDTIEARVEAVWRSVIQGPVGELSITDDFFEVGGDSLSSIRLGLRIGAEFGQEVPADVFLEEPTVERIAGFLRENGQHSGSLRPVRLNSGDPSRPPLIVLPPVSGTITMYMPVVRELPKTRTVYGLESRGLVPADSPILDVEGIASDFLARLSSVVETPVVHLLGFSMGGVMAFEMARQLRRQDSPFRSGMTGLLDTRSSVASVQDPNYALHSLLERVFDLPHDVDHFLAMDQESRARELLEAAVARGALPANFSIGQVQRMIDAYSNNLEALAAYEFPSADLEPVLFRVTDRSKESPPLADDLGWSSVVSNLRIVAVPGDHFTMIQPPNVSVLASSLEREMTRAEENR